MIISVTFSLQQKTRAIYLNRGNICMHFISFYVNERHGNKFTFKKENFISLIQSLFWLFAAGYTTTICTNLIQRVLINSQGT